MEVQMLVGSKPATMRMGHLQNLHSIRALTFKSLEGGKMEEK